jgi:hypothetical protein
MDKFVVISEESVFNRERTNLGKQYLESFAQKPIFKTFNFLSLSNDSMGYFDKKTAEYALKKYANKDRYEILPYEIAVKEFEQYKTL